MSNQYPPPHPPQPGFGPPPMPKKSRTGLILGLVIGVVLLLGLAGGGVWFFLGGGPGGSQTSDAFIDGYDPVVTAAEAGIQYNVTKPESYDICGDLEMAALTKMLPFEDGPEGVTETNDHGTGTAYVSCGGTMRGKIEVDDNNPTGSLDARFEVMNDSAAVEESFEHMWEKYSRYDKPLGEVKLGDAAEAKYRAENNGIGIAVVFRNGNMLGTLLLGMTYGRYFEPPDKQMMINLLLDIGNSGMTALSKS